MVRESGIHLANLRSFPNKTDELHSQTNNDFSNSASLFHGNLAEGFQLFRVDHDAQSAGNSRGGGTYFYIKERWCTDVKALKKKKILSQSRSAIY